MSRWIGSAIGTILLLVLLAGCGEQVIPTITPEAGALNFFFFLREGATNNAAAYWLPHELSADDTTKIKQAADRLSQRQFRNPKAIVSTPLSLTPQPNTDQGASVNVTVTAEISQTDGSWQADAPLLKLQMTSTSIGWRVRDFTLLDAAPKKDDY